MRGKKPCGGGWWASLPERTKLCGCLLPVAGEDSGPERVVRTAELAAKRPEVGLDRVARGHQLRSQFARHRPPGRLRPQPLPVLDHLPDRLRQVAARVLRRRARAEAFAALHPPLRLGELTGEWPLLSPDVGRRPYASDERCQAAVDRGEGRRDELAVAVRARERGGRRAARRGRAVPHGPNGGGATLAATHTERVHGAVQGADVPRTPRVGDAGRR